MKIFTGWDFNKSLERAIARNDSVRAQDEANKFRARELGERIAARKAMDEYREKALAETIRANQARENLTGRGQDITIRGQDIGVDEREKDRDWKTDEAEKGRDWRTDETQKGRDWTEDQTEKKWDREDELIKLGKTKEERQKKITDAAVLSTIPTFEEYDQNEAVTEMQDTLFFDEGEFRRAADQYIGDVQKNMPALLSAIQNDPSNPQVIKHLDDLEEIYKVLDGGEYWGPLDSTVFDWFDGEATGAKRSKARIARILSAAGRPID